MQLLELPFPFSRSVYIRTRGEVCLLSEQMQFFRLKDGQCHSTKGLNSRKRDSKVIDGVAQTHEVG